MNPDLQQLSPACRLFSLKVRVIQVFFVAFLLPAFTLAQEKDVYLSREVAAPGASSDSLYQRSLRFCGKGEEEFFITNEGVGDWKWTLRRGQWCAGEKFIPGLNASNDSSREIRATVALAIQKPPSACMRLLTVTGTVRIKCEDGKAKVAITDVWYYHCSTGAPPGRPMISDGNYPCHNMGSVRELKECKSCPKLMKGVFSFLDSSLARFMDHYEASLNN